jgi:tmRNA-binding protein
MDAIAAIDARELRDKLLYWAAEKMFDINKNTLQQRHQSKTHSNATEAEDRKLLSSQQEIQLVQYIEKLTGRSILPTESIIKYHAAAAGKWRPSHVWVTRFLG